MPAVADLVHAGRGVGARRLELQELLELESGAPLALEPGGTARVVFAVVDVARRSVAAGLVHPHLEAADGRWHALWGATLDEHLVDELQAIAHAAPAAAADAFEGDTRAFVHDLYACAVDELARRALREAGVSLRSASPPTAGIAERFLAGLAAPTPELPPDSGYVALERRVAAWVDGGLARRSRAPWNLGLRLDELDALSAADGPSVVLELLARGRRRPDARASGGAARERGRRGLRLPPRQRSAPRARPAARTIAPILADAGIALGGDPPTRAPLDAEQVRAFLRDSMPRLEALGVPLRLPREWVSSSSRVRVNLVASGPAAVSSGLLTSDAIASFDWRLAIGDVELTEDELRGARRGEGAADPPSRQRWHALRRARRRASAPIPRAARGARGRHRRPRARRLRASRRTTQASSSARSRSTQRSRTCSRAATSAASSRCRRRPG